MNLAGFIKLNRCIINWEWFNDNTVFAAFIKILLKANWQEGCWRGQKIERGSFISSTGHLSEYLNLTISQTRTVLKKLKLSGELTIKTTNKYSVYTIENYRKYQDSLPELTSKPPVTGHSKQQSKRTSFNNNIRKKNLRSKNYHNGQTFNQKAEPPFVDYQEETWTPPKD